MYIWFMYRCKYIYTVIKLQKELYVLEKNING